MPTRLLFDSVMATLTAFQRDVFYSSSLAQDDRHCLPFDAATLKSIIFPTRPSANVGDVAAARDHLIACGAYVRKFSKRSEWIEIVPAFRHNVGQDSTGFGEAEPVSEQGTLPLGPVAVVGKKKSAQGSGLRAQWAESAQGGALPETSNRVQRRGEESRTYPDSTALVTGENRGPGDRPPPPLSPFPPVQSENRGLSTGEESGSAPLRPDEAGKFARSEDELKATALGRKLWAFIGPKQMRREAAQSGARWLQLLRDRAEDLGELLEQGARIQASELPTGEARARFLTKRLCDRETHERKGAA